MSNLINEAVMRANVSMHDNLRGSSRFSEGSGERRGESVTQGGNVKEHGGEGKQDGESIDEYEEEDGDVEGAEETVVNLPSTRDTKPADWELWQKDRWAQRNAFRKARKLAARQKQQHQGAAETAMKFGHTAKVTKMAEEAAERVKKPNEQGTAEKATTEKSVSSERTQELTWLPTESHSQNSQFLPSQQYQQGSLAGYTHFGPGELSGAAYTTPSLAPDHLPARSFTWMSPRFAQELSSLSRTPQHRHSRTGG